MGKQLSRRQAYPRERKKPSSRMAVSIPRKSSKPRAVSFDGEATYSLDGKTMHLKLNWIPVSKKNRTRAILLGSKVPPQAGRPWKAPQVRWIPDSQVERQSQAVVKIAKTEDCPACDHTSEFRIRIHVLRKTPTEKKTGQRNSRRGDLVNMPGLICDALEGVWWGNDEQITVVEMTEERCQDADEFHINAEVMEI